MVIRTRISITRAARPERSSGPLLLSENGWSNGFTMVNTVVVQ